MKYIDLPRQYQAYKEAIDSGISEVLESGSFILGPQVDRLERELAEYAGVRWAVGVSSGTDALLLALMALGIGPGDEVLTTPFTFAATGETIALLGAKPVFVDIESATYNIDPDLLEEGISGRTRAIVAVSLYGQCADYDRIGEVAGRHGLPVIEDGAQSFGATRNGKRSCGLSTIGCTSFFPTKPLGCYGDGGMVFTDDEQLAGRVRRLSNHGQEGRYHHVEVGVNSRLDTLQAAVLLAKLPHFESEIRRRSALGEAYNALLGGVPGLVIPATARGNSHVFAQYSVRVEARDALASHLAAAGVPTAVHYPVPLHLQPAFAGFGRGPGSCPRSEEAASSIISLPLHPFMEDDDLELVAREVCSWAEGGSAGL